MLDPRLERPVRFALTTLILEERLEPLDEVLRVPPAAKPIDLPVAGDDALVIVGPKN